MTAVEPPETSERSAHGSAPDDVPLSVQVLRGEGGTRASRLGRIPRLTLAAIALVREAAPREMAGATVLQAVAASLLGVQLLVGRELIRELLELNRSGGSDVAPLLPVFGALIGATVLAGAVMAALQHQQRMLTELVGQHTMNGIIDVASEVELAAYEDPGFYDNLQRATAAGTFRPIAMVNSVTTLVTAVLTSVGVAVVLLTLEPLLLPLVVLAGVPLLFASLHNSRQSYSFEYSMTVHARERLHLMELLTGRESAKELRVFRAVPFLRRRYDVLTAERIARLRAFLRGRFLVSLVGTTATAVGTALALGSLVWLLATDRTDVATAVTAAIAMQLLASRLVSITGALSKIVESGMFLDDYRLFMDLRQAERQVARDGGRSARDEQFRSVEVRDLTFAYPKTERVVLDDVSIELRAGEVVALVGENGSGKTTLVKLLCQLYRTPQRGQILWNGEDAAALDPKEIQEHVTILFQDFVQYQLSVAENIALGRTGAAVDRAAVEEAARRAGAHEMITRLPRGYDTRLGRQFHGGFELSGGQWQRLALARAFYRGGDVLVLDEPTAALDPRAEYELFLQMRDLAKGKSVLLISHRFSSVRMADRIYVLADGRVVERGTHRELMDRDGLYAELFTLQAEAYLGEKVRPSAEAADSSRGDE